MKVMVKYLDGRVDIVGAEYAKRLFRLKKATFIKFVKDKVDVVIK